MMPMSCAALGGEIESLEFGRDAREVVVVRHHNRQISHDAARA